MSTRGRAHARAALRLFCPLLLASSVAAQNTGATGGIVRHGEGEGSLIVDRITKDTLVKEGDVIVTAGTRSKQYPSLFPANIPIGYVISVGQSDTAPFKQIQIQPFVDFSSLDAVTALITKKKNPQAP